MDSLLTIFLIAINPKKSALKSRDVRAVKDMTVKTELIRLWTQTSSNFHSHGG